MLTLCLQQRTRNIKYQVKCSSNMQSIYELCLMALNNTLLGNQKEQLWMLHSDAREKVDGSESLLLQMKLITNSGTPFANPFKIK